MRWRVSRLFPKGPPTAAALGAIALAFLAPAAWAQQVAPVPVPPVTTEQLPITDSAPEPQLLTLALNKTHLIELPAPVSEVILANPAIADVVVKTPTKIYLMAKAAGSTNVFFLGEDDEVIMHLSLQVDIDLTAAQATIETLLPNARIELSTAGGAVVLTGTVRSARELADAAAIAGRFTGTGGTVINMLRILEDMQVMLHVRIAEIQRSVTKSLGINSSLSRSFGGRQFSATSTNLLGVTTNIAGRIAIDAFGITTATFNALEQQGLVKTLAEPILIAISGETANFLAGGEFPAPTGVDKEGNVVFELKEFGVKLAFTPTVLDNDQISLKIFTEITAVTTQNAITVKGVLIRGLTKRTAESTVTLPSGGSIMIAGLLQNDEINSISGAPWLKDIPILGALFRSTSFASSQTELVILLTAYLIQPVESGMDLSMPTDGFVPASDFDLHLMGRLFKKYSKNKGTMEIPSVRGPFGYIME